MTSILETDRLRIRRIEDSDFAEMMGVYGDLELMKYVGDSTAISPEDCRRWIEITKENYAKSGYGLFAVENLEGGVIGFAGISHPGGQDQPEIKYTFKKAVWGSGIATEVVSALTQHGFAAWNLPEVIATIDPENLASARVLTKAGFIRGADRVNDDQTVTQVWYQRPKF